MRIFYRSFCIGVVVFVIDQLIKYWAVVSDLYIQSSPISLILAYNKGVAFSMFAFLDESLKYIQLVLMFGIAVYLYKNPLIFKMHYIPAGLLFGAAFGNICDRFTYGAVVDYIFWHYGFEFAIFNFADVIINCAVALLLYQNLMSKNTTN